MNIKQALSIPAIFAGLVLSGQALADSAMHVTPEGPTKFYPAHGSGSKSAEQVQKELEEFRRNPVSADGLYRYVGGDQIWVPVSHKYAYSDGKWQHADTLPHNEPASSSQMTPEEKKQRDAWYRG